MKIVAGLILALSAMALCVVIYTALQLQTLNSSLQSGPKQIEVEAAMVTIHRNYKCPNSGETGTATATYDPEATTPTEAGKWLDKAIEYLTTTC